MGQMSPRTEVKESFWLCKVRVNFGIKCLFFDSGQCRTFLYPSLERAELFSKGALDKRSVR